MPATEVVKWDAQEPVPEPTVEHAPVSVVKSFGDGEARSPGIAKHRATTAAEAVASTAAESVDGFEAWPQGVEVPIFVFRDKIQQRAFEQLAGFSEEVEKSVFEVPSLVCQDRVQQRTVEQFADIPEATVSLNVFVNFCQRTTKKSSRPTAPIPCACCNGTAAPFSFPFAPACDRASSCCVA